MKKMTLQEYLSVVESKDGEIDVSWKHFYLHRLPEMLSEENTIEHNGDCTRQPCPCNLCSLERMLKDYREYFFDIESED